jgi:hypothetical protein
MGTHENLIDRALHWRDELDKAEAGETAYVVISTCLERVIDTDGNPMLFGQCEAMRFGRRKDANAEALKHNLRAAKADAAKSGMPFFGAVPLDKAIRTHWLRLSNAVRASNLANAEVRVSEKGAPQ